MGSRETDQMAPHQPLLSSLVIRPADSGLGAAGDVGGGGGDYEPGEVRGDAPPPYSRSDRFHDDHGGHRDRGFGNGRDLGRYRDFSPPRYNSHGRDGGRISGKGYDGHQYGVSNPRGDAASRNNPNVRPREGDWDCPECKNLNFARREFCNNCKRPRYASGGSPRRGRHPEPPFPPPRRFPGPPSDRSPVRFMNGHRPPPRVWDRDDLRDFRAGGPAYPRREGRLPVLPPRKDRPDYPVDGYEERHRFGRPMPLDWANRDHGRESLFNDRKGYVRRPQSPPQMPAFPSRGQWDRGFRDRSLSPVRGGAPPKDYRRDMGRGIDDRRGIARGAY